MKNEEKEILDLEDFDIMLDIVNVYNPDDIKDIYPEMGDQKFIDGVERVFRKLLKIREEIMQEEFLKHLVVDTNA